MTQKLKSILGFTSDDSLQVWSMISSALVVMVVVAKKRKGRRTRKGKTREVEGEVLMAFGSLLIFSPMNFDAFGGFGDVCFCFDWKEM